MDGAIVHRGEIDLHYKEAGKGPFVLCLHSFWSSSGQYRGLMERLQGRFRVVAADLYGHGASTPWPGARRFTLADEAAPLEALLPDGGPVHLVGHSYGAAVALRIAATNRARVRSMVLYEPAIFGTLLQLRPDDPGTLEIEGVRERVAELIGAGRLEDAARCFVEYWSGPGTWTVTPEDRKLRMIASVQSLRTAWLASFLECWTAPALRSLDIPCLLIGGTRSPAAARRASKLLRDALPRAELTELEGVGHLGPITHPERVDKLTEAFLGRAGARVPLAALG